ncbi:uncharacterized protein LOC143452259 isoform X2 [Clavelina lepadiformis]|uniref:uncharacterized protein LOC143452259 isoform X2 n=1 Tax=Clavelina lepadiformis TaxID=159417 RepID=UPI0040423F81
MEKMIKVLDNLTSLEFDVKLDGDPVFRDYFNKFCCLPIFGQRTCYVPKKTKFFFDPPPMRAAAGKKNVAYGNVKDWLWEERFPLFLRSVVGAEFVLCKSLCEQTLVDVDFTGSEKNQNASYHHNKSKLETLFRVRHMKEFVKLVESSESDNNIIRFWIDAFRLRLCNPCQQKINLRAIQRKYFMATSPYCLPYFILETVLCENDVIESNCMNYDTTMKLASTVWKRLQSYWLRRYLVSCSRQRSVAALDRKQMVIWENNKEEQKLKVLHRSPYVRFIQNPDLKQKVLQEDDTDEYEEDLDRIPNILIQEQMEEEIWPDELQLERLSNQRKSEMLGVENIAFIHDHIFAKETKLAKVHDPALPVVKENRSKTREHYELAPGRMVSVTKKDFDAHISSDQHHALRRYSVSATVHPTCPPVSLEVNENRSACSPEDDERLMWTSVERKMEGPLLPSINNKGAESVAPDYSMYSRKTKSAAVRLLSGKAVKKSLSEIVDSSDSLSIEESQTSLFPPINSVSSQSTVRAISSGKSNISSVRSIMSDDFDILSGNSKKTPFNVSSRRSSSTPISLPNVTGEYLKSVEPGMKLGDILAADEPAGFPFRSYLAKCCNVGQDPNSCGDAALLINSVTAFDLWREIEHLHRKYFATETVPLSHEFNSLLKKLRSLNIPQYSFVTTLKLCNDEPFPEKLISLQNDFENMIETEWIEFAISEQKTFRDVVVATEIKTYKRRSSFPNCLAEVRQLPILCQPQVIVESSEAYKEFEKFARMGNFGNLGPNGTSHMRYRTSRAYHLLVKTRPINLNQHAPNDEFIGEFSSDEEGDVPPSKPKNFSKLLKLDTKAIAKLSVRQYPGQGIDYAMYKQFPTVDRYRVDTKPLYLRPIKKHGVLLRRPSVRPKTLSEVLRDPLHFEFFKRYMKMHKSEAPLLFWKAVELLRRTESPTVRQRKAQQILKKFFGHLAGGGAMLQCNADIIKEISAVDTVTTSMLAKACVEVQKSMERNWGKRYFSTFPVVPIEEEEESPEKKLSMAGFKRKHGHIWDVFSEFMRRAACFIKSMRRPHEYEKFSQYLKGILDRPDSSGRDSGDASETAMAFREMQTVIYKHMNTDLSLSHRSRKIFGKQVTLNFLANDLTFWLEADRYVTMADNIQNIVMAGCYEQYDTDIVKEKSKRIVKCFLDSNVPPRTRVNVEKELADTVTKNVYKGLFDRGIFHDGVLSIFPVLLHFWKTYREERFRYVSKQEIREHHRKEVFERRRRILKRTERRKKMLMNKEKLRSAASLDSDLNLRQSSSLLYPDYVNGLCKKKEPFERVKGLLFNDPPTLHFTLEHGLKLILPPRKKLVDGSSDPQEDQFFLSVWTRGAKVVNVIREGSDPKLVNLEERQKNFKVECDLIED